MFLFVFVFQKEFQHQCKIYYFLNKQKKMFVLINIKKSSDKVELIDVTPPPPASTAETNTPDTTTQQQKTLSPRSKLHLRPRSPAPTPSSQQKKGSRIYSRQVLCLMVFVCCKQFNFCFRIGVSKVVWLH